MLLDPRGTMNTEKTKNPLGNIAPLLGDYLEQTPALAFLGTRELQNPRASRGYSVVLAAVSPPKIYRRYLAVTIQ